MYLYQGVLELKGIGACVSLEEELVMVTTGHHWLPLVTTGYYFLPLDCADLLQYYEGIINNATECVK